MLAFCSIFAGFIELPHNFGHVQIVSGFLEGVLPGVPPTENGPGAEFTLQMVSGLVCVAGVLTAYVLFLRHPAHVRSLASTAGGALVHRFLMSGCGFDRVYRSGHCTTFCVDCAG